MAISASNVRPAPSRKLWVAISLFLVALSFRPAIVAAAPLLAQINAGIGLSASAGGLLLTLPVLCFGLVGPSAPLLARRFGLERTLAGVLVAVVVGSALRLWPTAPGLFAGTVVIGAGIAVGNILLPVLIKRDFSGSIGMMSGLYTLSITGGAALAAGVTVPIAQAAGVDWNVALAAWGLLAVVGLASLIPGMVKDRDQTSATALPSTAASTLLADPVAWMVTIFFALQSLNFYSMTTWIPTILISYGFSPALAGLILSLNSLVSILPAMVTPVIMTRLKRQSFLAVGLAAFYAIALAGFIMLPGGAALWVSVLGVGQGGTLGFALTLIVLRSPDTENAARLSGMTQSWGYALAAMGPFALGAVFDLTKSWTVPLVILLLLVIPQAVMGFRAGRPRMVGMGNSAQRQS